MSKPKFTPGPWALQRYEFDGLPVADVFASDGECVTACLHIENARLIAAAPELHAVLSAIKGDPRTVLCMELRQSLDAALAKVEGEGNG